MVWSKTESGKIKVVVHYSLNLNTMFTNNLYNLMMQAVEEHKSLWRIKDDYMQDANQSPESIMFWEKMISDKENHISELKELIKKEIEK